MTPRTRTAHRPKPHTGRGCIDAKPQQGEVLFNVAFKFDVNGFDNWKPEQIAAFLKGLGDVVAIQDVSKERGA